ncbi:hypothetical protein VC95412_003383A, partial [Vibrio cholerae O1 str. 95412]
MKICHKRHYSQA